MATPYEIKITPGVDTALRVFAETPGGFHLLSTADSYHDAKAAKRAAEEALWMLDAVFMAGGRGAV